MFSKINFLWRLPSIQLAASFLVCLSIFSYLQPPQVFADPDSWYHTRLTTMMRDGGLVYDFPWTQATLYRTVFIDHHFLYHVLLSPFISLSPIDLSGLQLATIVFAALSAMAVVWLMKRWRVPYWGVGLLILLTSAPFLFRLSLGKAPSLAIGVTLISYYLIVERKLVWLFFMAWFYVWFYSAWPLVIIMSAIYIIVSSADKADKGLKAVWQELITKPNIKLIAVVFGGVIVGLMVNPYFPTNLAYLKQIFGMALTPYHDFIGIGAEWYPMNPVDLPEYLSYPLLFWLVATLSAVFTWRRQTTLSRTSWIMAVLFFIYTLRARRQTEYFVPWMILSAGLCFRDAGVGNLTAAYFKQKFSSWIPSWLKNKAVIWLLIIYGLAVVPWGLLHGTRLAKALLASGYTFNSMSGVSNWLAKNTSSGTIVFQSDWGTFPMLFYHNQSNYYLTGLDQTFMYEYDQEKYRQWVRASKGETPKIYQIAKDIFGAQYLILEKRTPSMLMWLNRDSKFIKVYEDSEAIVYSLQ